MGKVDQKELNKFLNELTDLCRKYKLYPIHRNYQGVIIENDLCKKIADGFEYDMEAQSYTARISKDDERF